MKRRNLIAVLLLVAVGALSVACDKMSGPVGPSNSAFINADPSTVQVGQMTTLSWSSSCPTITAEGDIVEGWSGQLPGYSQRQIGPFTRAGNFVFRFTCGAEVATTTVVVTASVPGDQNSWVTSDRLVNISVVAIVPGRDQAVAAGRPEYIQLNVANNSDKVLAVYGTIVDSEGENPGQPGRRSNLISGILQVVPAHESRVVTFGMVTVGSSESVPWLRVTGYYDNSERFGTQNPAWAISVRLGWVRQ